MRTISSLAQSARRYKRLLIARGVHSGPIMRDLIRYTWSYKHGSRSDELTRRLDLTNERARTLLRDLRGGE